MFSRLFRIFLVLLTTFVLPDSKVLAHAFNNRTPLPEHGICIEQQALSVRVLTDKFHYSYSSAKISLGAFYLLMLRASAHAQQETMGWRPVPLEPLRIALYAGFILHLMNKRPVEERSKTYMFWMWQLRLLVGTVISLWIVFHFANRSIVDPFELKFDWQLISGYALDLVTFSVSLSGIHQWGHYLFGKFSGAEIKSFARATLGRHTLGQRIAFLLGGPIINLVVSGILLGVRPFVESSTEIASASVIINELLVMNFVMGFGALLPLPGGGGGLLILRLLREWLRTKEIAAFNLGRPRTRCINKSS